MFETSVKNDKIFKIFLILLVGMKLCIIYRNPCLFCFRNIWKLLQICITVIKLIFKNIDRTHYSNLAFKFQNTLVGHFGMTIKLIQVYLACDYVWHINYLQPLEYILKYTFLMLSHWHWLSITLTKTFKIIFFFVEIKYM